MLSSSDLRAAGVMLVVSLTFSSVMVLLAWAGGRGPLVVAALSGLGSWLVFILWFVARYGALLRSPGLLPYLVCRLASPLPFLVVVGYYDFAVLAYAFGLVAPEVVGVLFEIWPLWLVLVVSRFTGEAYDPFGWRSFLGVLGAFSGAATVVAGASGGFAAVWALASSGGWPGVVLSVLLPFGAAMLTGFTGCTWVWASAQARRTDLPPVLLETMSEPGRQMFFLSACPCLSVLVFAVTAFSLASFAGAFSGWDEVRLPFFVGLASGLVYGCAGLLWRLSTIMTRNVGVHAVNYVTPVFTVLLLWGVGLGGAVAPPYLAIGLLLLVTSNLSVSVRGFWGFLRSRAVASVFRPRP